MKDNNGNSSFAGMKLAILGVVVVIVLIFLWSFSPLVIVPAGHSGVVTLFGKVDETALPEGPHFINPAAHVTNMTTQIQKADENGDGASKDLQTVNTTVTVNFHLAAAKAPSLYHNIGLNFEPTVISPAVKESFKASVAKYTAEELVTKREMVRDSIKTLLSEKLKSATNDSIILDEISITSFKFSGQFEAAIESKQVAEQNALKAQRDLERIQIEAKQSVARAEAEAAGLKAQKEQITDDLLRLRQIETQKLAIEKWDGRLPTYMMGSTVPIISMDSMQFAAKKQ